jgi:hypothetical protein
MCHYNDYYQNDLQRIIHSLEGVVLRHPICAPTEYTPSRCFFSHMIHDMRPTSRKILCCFSLLRECIALVAAMHTSFHEGTCINNALDNVLTRIDFFPIQPILFILFIIDDISLLFYSR